MEEGNQEGNGLGEKRTRGKRNQGSKEGCKWAKKGIMNMNGKYYIHFTESRTRPWVGEASAVFFFCEDRLTYCTVQKSVYA